MIYGILVESRDVLVELVRGCTYLHGLLTSLCDMAYITYSRSSSSKYPKSLQTLLCISPTRIFKKLHVLYIAHVFLMWEEPQEKLDIEQRSVLPAYRQFGDALPNSKGSVRQYFIDKKLVSKRKWIGVLNDLRK